LQEYFSLEFGGQKYYDEKEGIIKSIENQKISQNSRK